MSWWTDYAELNLDEIIQITAADDAHAPELDEQAVAVAELAGRVRASLELVHRARKRLGVGLAGLSGRAAAERSGDLADRTGEATARLDRHESTFAEVAALARATHGRMSALREERDLALERLRANPADTRLLAEYGDGWLDDPAMLESSIRERFDDDARQRMRDSADAYLDRAGSLEPVTEYDGPRRPGESGGFGGDDSGADGSSGYGGSRNRSDHNASGPELVRVAAPGSDFASSPQLQSGPVTAPVAPTPAASGLATSGGHFVPPVPVTPPVIGARPSPTTAITPRTPTLRPNTSGFTRPVFGERPGKAVDALGRRQPAPVVRPGPGTRPATLPNPAPGRGTPSGSVRAVPTRTATTGQPRLGTVGRTGARVSGGGAPTNSARPSAARSQPDTVGRHGARGAGGGAPNSARPSAGYPRLGTPGRNGSQTSVGGGTAGPSRTPSAGNPQPETLGRNGFQDSDGGAPGQARPSATVGTEPNGPGTRAVPTARRQPVGRVIRAETAELHVRRVEFTRRPRVEHGGTDGLNRPVIRGSRALSRPRPAPATASPPPEPVDTELWPTPSGTVPSVIRPGRTGDTTHDPGFFLTPDNLGGRDPV